MLVGRAMSKIQAVYENVILCFSGDLCLSSEVMRPKETFPQCPLKELPISTVAEAKFIGTTFPREVFAGI